MNAYWKDIFRTILKEKKRLIALMVIAALGVTMMCGLRASCNDLRQSADSFFDAQHLHDLSIVATLGLTEEDVQAISRIEGVKVAEGEYTETLKMQADKGSQMTTTVKTLSESGIDMPALKDGHLPEKADEMAVTEKTLALWDKKIGESVTFKEEVKENETADFKCTTFVITGTVVDVTSVINPDGTTSFRDEGCTTATGFVLKDVIVSDLFTSVNILLAGTEELNAFSDAYLQKVRIVEERIKNQILESREKARTLTVISDAEKTLSQAENEANEAFSQAEAELTAGREELDDGWHAYESGKSTLESESQNAEEMIASSRATIEANKSALQAETSQLNAERAALDEAYAKREITAGAYYAGLAKIAVRRLEIEAGMQTIASAEETLNEEERSFYEQQAMALAELESGRSSLMEGEATLAEGYGEYLSEKEKAEAELAKGKAEISEIEPCCWYIRECGALNAVSALIADADCIESIGTVFPVMFLLVAVLISLTTITRMIEENRGNIGTYKGLGYSNREILRKYMAYAGIAAFLGGILGNVFGYVVLPEIIIIIFKTMYLLPKFTLGYDALYGISGILLFVLAICGATWFSCRATLKQKTAELMRPKAPRAGEKILPEHIPFIWNRLSFLRKVTARNLFRYKKRLLMTIFGIMGCTALLICGFSIKNTVADILPNQYEKIIRYDVMSVDTGGEDHRALRDALQKSDVVESMLSLQISEANLINAEGESLSVTLYVIPDDADLSPYLNLTDTEGEKFILPDAGVAVTENAGTVLNFGAGDRVKIQNLSLDLAEAKAEALVTYYLGNVIFVRESAYRRLFPGSDASPNGFLINLKAGTEIQAFTDSLENRDCILSAVSTKELKDTFSDAFALINMVVYVVIILAGALAFVVLFTLSTTNISERERELATIKVLGFVDREVYRYVNKETIILTFLGIVFGLPMGTLLSHFIGVALKLPAIVYRPSIHVLSYFLAAGIALIFALIVNVFTNPVIRRINPVTALKSVE